MSTQPRTWSARKLLDALVLGSWCFLFWFLMAADRVPLYLSTRTDWIVPMGAVVLTAVTIGQLVAARSSTPDPAGRRDLVGAAVLLLPVLFVLALPTASLGSFAADRRSTLSAGYSASAEDILEGDISLVDVGAALRSDEAMAALTERAGEQVSFTGFVTRDKGDPAGEFTLNRFVISCCVADALAVKARVVGAPPGLVESDEWVRVQGSIYPLNDEIVVDASAVETVPRPDRPYLNP